MKNTIKKSIFATSALALLAGCSTMCGHHDTMPAQKQHHQETVVFQQNYTNADTSKVYAKMYTRSRHGGESKMGYIKFIETDNGLKMKTDLQDMRPNIKYTLKVYQCDSCNDESTCCDKNPMAIDLPQLHIDHVGTLQDTYIIRGLTATQLKNAKIYMERDGGYKAAWGTLK